MSTVFALQDMNALANKDMAMRQRKMSKPNAKQTEEDPWLNEPHDLESAKLPLDAPSLQPTAVYWISPHGMLSKKITVTDLTKDMGVPYQGMTNEYKEEVKKTLKDHSFTPIITCSRLSWIGLKYDLTDDQNKTIGHWSHPWHSGGEALLTFPDDSLHCAHPISLRNKRWGLRTESFVVNSVPFLWEMDSMWHSTNMTLYKLIGSGENQKRTAVAKYAQKCWGAFVTGGTLVLDEKEIDGVVASLTLIVVLKKKRQRAAERRHAGE